LGPTITPITPRRCASLVQASPLSLPRRPAPPSRSAVTLLSACPNLPP
jgi:hypothetical protein